MGGGRKPRLAGWARLALGVAALASAVCAAQGLPQARSADGRWQLSGLDDPPRIELRDAEGRLARTQPARSADGQRTSRVHAVLAVPQRQSFLVLFDTLAELWELSIDPRAEPIYDGLVHDFRMGEGVARPGHLGVRRMALAEPLLQPRVLPTLAQVVGRTGADAQGRRWVQVVHLDVRRTVARLRLGPDPRPAEGVWLVRPGADPAQAGWLAIPDGQASGLVLLDLDRWQAERCVDTPGPVQRLVPLPQATPTQATGPSPDPGSERPATRLQAEGRDAAGRPWHLAIDADAAAPGRCHPPTP